MEQVESRLWTAAVAETIRAERAASRKTQAEVARAAGIPRVTYIRYETGERVPNLAKLIQIAGGLGMEFSTFVARAEARVKEASK